MNREKIFQRACRMLEEWGHEAQFRADYSGRGMYGRTCEAIVTDAPAALVGYIIACAIHVATDGEGNMEDHIELIPMRSDNMGLSMVYY